jgi:hypothetical protein
VCGVGTVATVDGTASEADPADFGITGATGATMCTATESPIPTGYTSSGTCSASVSAGTCTITNSAVATLVVNKDFGDNNPADVNIQVTCTSGTVANDDTTASEADPANFTITNYGPGTTCTATENPVPAGYSAAQGSCANLSIMSHSASCTITNAVVAGVVSFTVNKDFSDDNPMDVTVQLSCSPGAVVGPNDNTASESDPADFTVDNVFGTTCSASETAPAGYVADTSACQNVPLTTGSCTITNTPGAPAVGGLVEISTFGGGGSDGGCCGAGATLLAALAGTLAVCSAGVYTAMRRR